MNYSNTYIDQFTSPGHRSSFRHRMSSFIEQHIGVFQALSRQGIPYGGNWLPDIQPEVLQPAELTAEKMAEVERELDEIILRLSQLSGSLNAGQPAGSSHHQADTGNRANGRTNEIGIERFRALQFGA